MYIYKEKNNSFMTYNYCIIDNKRGDKEPAATCNINDVQ